MTGDFNDQQSMSTTMPDSRRLKQLENELAAVKGELDRRDKAWQAELEIAARVHQGLLPGPIQHPRIDVVTRYVPLEKVGGDYCQVVLPDESCCYVTMCDVTGHGIGPALLATRVSSLVRTLVFEQRKPMEVVRKLNEFIIEHFLDTDLQLTFFAARIDLNKGTITYSGAGHPDPMLIRKGSRSVEMLPSQNTLIGVFDQCLADVPQDVKDISPGDRLLFFTDGVPETVDSNNKMLGTDGLIGIATMTCASDLFDMADGILSQVESWRSGPPQDDMTLIIAEIK